MGQQKQHRQNRCSGFFRLFWCSGVPVFLVLVHAEYLYAYFLLVILGHFNIVEVIVLFWRFFHSTRLHCAQLRQQNVLVVAILFLHVPPS